MMNFTMSKYEEWCFTEKIYISLIIFVEILMGNYIYAIKLETCICVKLIINMEDVCDWIKLF